MGLLDWFKRKKGLNPNTTEYGMIPVNSVAISPYMEADWVKAYKSSADLYAVAQFLVRKAASIPWYVYQVKDGQKAKVALTRYKSLSHGIGSPGVMDKLISVRKDAYDPDMIIEGTDLANLLKRPNPNQGQDAFFEALFGYRVISGEANIWGNDGMIQNGQFVELQVLPTQYVKDYYDKSDVYGILGHRLEIGAGVNLPKENVLRWKNWRPDFDAYTRVHMRGISVVEVAWKTYLMGDNGGAAMASMLKNGGSRGALSPAVVGNTVVNMTPEQLAEATKQINNRFNGLDNANSIGILAKPYDYLNFGLSAVDMDIVKVMDLTLHQWCRVLGLPTVLFDTAHTADNNYQNAMRDLVTNTIMPMMASARDELNRWLLPRFKDRNVFIDYDVSALPELQRDMEKMSNWVMKSWVLTPNEMRECLGYEPVVDPTMDTVLVPSGYSKLEDIGMDLTPLPDNDVQY
jgi:HK97 family phage portal protein